MKGNQMRVLLNYFKQSGKWYSDGSYETKFTKEDGLYEIWEEIKKMFDEEIRPGLVNGKQEFNTLVDVPEHPHNHPHIIMSNKR